jgi:hypothetical protein
MMKIKKFGALLVSAVLCIGMAAPAFAYEGDTTPVEEPVLPEIVEEEDAVTITDEETGALTPEGNLTLVDDSLLLEYTQDFLYISCSALETPP